LLTTNGRGSPLSNIVATYWNDAFSVGLVLALAFTLLALRRALRRERELARYGKAFTVACFDIDDFKAVNDRYGHAAGDAVLRLAADTAKRTIRASDAVARLGGDEFAILLHETTPAASETVIRKLRMAIQRLGR